MSKMMSHLYLWTDQLRLFSLKSPGIENQSVGQSKDLKDPFNEIELSQSEFELRAKPDELQIVIRACRHP